MIIPWGTKVTRGFIAEVFSICGKWYPDAPADLMSCIAFESAESFSPSIKNMAGSGATGLIQFMPLTAIGLGTTVENLELLSAESQLYYVGKYFEPYARRIKSLPDMYMAILLPKYVGAPDSSVLFSGDTKAYRQNSGLDKNSDGKITKLEAASMVQAKKDKGLRLYPLNWSAAL